MSKCSVCIITKISYTITYVSLTLMCICEVSKLVHINGRSGLQTIVSRQGCKSAEDFQWMLVIISSNDFLLSTVDCKSFHMFMDPEFSSQQLKFVTYNMVI